MEIHFIETQRIKNKDGKVEETTKDILFEAHETELAHSVAKRYVEYRQKHLGFLRPPPGVKFALRNYGRGTMLNQNLTLKELLKGGVLTFELGVVE